MEPTPIVWQVEYKHFGFVYWWDYPSADIISVLEACHANKADMYFTWTWPMGRVATYRTRIAAGIVVNTLTEHERKLRRLHVHLGDDVAMSEDQEMGDQVQVLDPVEASSCLPMKSPSVLQVEDPFLQKVATVAMVPTVTVCLEIPVLDFYTAAKAVAVVLAVTSISAPTVHQIS